MQLAHRSLSPSRCLQGRVYGNQPHSLSRCQLRVVIAERQFDDQILVGQVYWVWFGIWTRLEPSDSWPHAQHHWPGLQLRVNKGGSWVRITQPTNHPTNQPTNQPASQPASQPTHQPNNQPTNEPTSTPAREPDIRTRGRLARKHFSPSASHHVLLALCNLALCNLALCHLALCHLALW